MEYVRVLRLFAFWLMLQIVPRSIRHFNEPLNMHDTWLKCVITSEW